LREGAVRGVLWQVPDLYYYIKYAQENVHDFADSLGQAPNLMQGHMRKIEDWRHEVTHQLTALNQVC
jgi:hypothetical protein